MVPPLKPSPSSKSSPQLQPTFLQLEEVLVIHTTMIRVGGGTPGLRDALLLHAAVERPKATFNGVYLYTSLEQMAGALFQSLLKNHVFLDGNKRTAFFCMLRFLQQNGVEIQVSNQEVIEFVIDAETSSFSTQQISDWLKQHRAPA